ncbi:CopG family transcriptional regulator, partial [Natronoarchaeum mannanilyticum]
MSKITFRADDDLVEELETFETSKSEVMRRALREYLEASDVADDATEDAPDAETALESPDDAARPESLDDMLAARVDELVERRVDAALDERLGAGHA